MSMNRTAAWLLALVAASTLFVAASAGRERPAGDLPAADKKLLDELLGAGVLGAGVSGGVIETPADWLHLVARSDTFQATAGPAKGHAVSVSLEQRRDDEKTKTWREALGPDKTLFFQLTPKGEVTLTSTQDSKGGTITSFTPSAPQVLPGMKPGDVKKATLKVQVYDFSHPDKLEHEGSLDQELTHLGMYSVSVPAGEFEAVLLRSHMQGKVGPAKIDETEYKLLVKDKGLVALVDTTDIAAGIFYKKHDKSALVLSKGK